MPTATVSTADALAHRDREAPQPPPAQTPTGRWGPGRISALISASLVGLLAVAAVAVGTTGIVADQTQRDSSGYVMSDSTTYSTSTYALVSASYRALTSNDWPLIRDLLGTVRVRVSSASPVFIGIGPQSAVSSYLASVAHAQGVRFDERSKSVRVHPGAAPSSPPTAQRFWAVSAVGSGPHTLNWKPADGDWRIVLMNPDGSARVRADVSVGARFPHVLAIASALLGSGLLLLVLSGGAIYFAVRTRRARSG
jgi:hypothetical protein